MAEQNFVDLVCVKEGNRLRVRITSPGYLLHANCQFPRNIRLEGRHFRAPAQDVRLVVGSRNFYHVGSRNIQIVEVPAAIGQEPVGKVKMKIFEDPDEAACIICTEIPKDTVFAPCGHFHCCSKCAAAVNTCPICRTPVTARINKSQIE